MSFLHQCLFASGGILKIFDANWIEDFLHRIHPWEYFVLFAIIFAESGLLIGFFLPGDTLLFTAGFLAYKGDLNIWLLVPLLFLAAFAGDQTGYFVGRRAGEKFFTKENAKILKKSHVEKTHAFFEKYGGKTIILARFVPIVRTLAPVMAGTGKMSYKKFVSFNAIGAALWGIGITLLGYFLGKSIGAEKVDKYLLPIIAVIFVASFIPPAIEWYLHKKKKAALTPDPE
jgi:membrane-associated protein